MCNASENGFLIGIIVLGCLALPAMRAQARSAPSNQSGFTLVEMGAWLVGAVVVITIGYLLLTNCWGKGAAPFGTPTPLSPGAVSKGAAAPASAPAPSCQSGDSCTSPGKYCAPGLVCTNTYSWDTTTAKWRCDCDCR